MTQPTVDAWHIDGPMTNLSIANLQSAEGFIASKMFPNVPVANQSDKYHVFPKASMNRDEMKERAAGAPAARMGIEKSEGSYSVEEFALEYPIPDQTRANADVAAPPETAARATLANKAMIKREKRFSTAFMTTGVWGTDITGVAGSPGAGQVRQWSDYTNSDPIEDMASAIETMLQETGLRPNVCGMGYNVWKQLMNHPDIQARISGGATTDRPSIVNRQLVAALFEVDEITVGSAIENTAAEGATENSQFIIGKSLLLAHRTATPGIMVPSAGYHFNWNGYLPGANEFGYVIDTMRDAPADSDIFRARMADAPTVTSADLGYFFDSLVA